MSDRPSFVSARATLPAPHVLDLSGCVLGLARHPPSASSPPSLLGIIAQRAFIISRRNATVTAFVPTALHARDHIFRIAHLAGNQGDAGADRAGPTGLPYPLASDAHPGYAKAYGPAIAAGGACHTTKPTLLHRGL